MSPTMAPQTKIKLKLMSAREDEGNPMEEIAKREGMADTSESKERIDRERLHQEAREQFQETGERETVIYKDEVFNVYKRLAEVRGPLVELGGPTEGGYDLVDTYKIGKKIHVSNLFEGSPTFDTGGVIGYKGPVDFRADARNLPLKPESVGAIFIKALGEIETEEDETPVEEMMIQQKKLRMDAAKEAARMLEPGGVLILESFDELELIDLAKESGLKLVEQRMSYSEGNDAISFDFMFEKIG